MRILIGIIPCIFFRFQTIFCSQWLHFFFKIPKHKPDQLKFCLFHGSFYLDPRLEIQQERKKWKGDTVIKQDPLYFLVRKYLRMAYGIASLPEGNIKIHDYAICRCYPYDGR